MVTTGEQVGVVAALARYPVKSVGGEGAAAVELDARGVIGDRLWAAYTTDGGIGSGKTSRRFRRLDGLLACRSWLEGTTPWLELPDGDAFRVDDPVAAEALSALVGQPVTLAPEGDVPHHDDAPIHVVTTAGLDRLGELLGEVPDARRFRANIVLTVDDVGFVEDGWLGRELHVGDDVVLRLDDLMPRCVMVTMTQRHLSPDRRVLQQLAAAHGGDFGLMASVVCPGTLRDGDAAVVV